MCSHQAVVTQFVKYFRGHAATLNAVSPLLYRKILYATALEPLARAAFGESDNHRSRITRLLDELTDWDEKHRISLPQLALTLQANGRTSNQLYRRVQESLSEWIVGEVLLIAASPHISELSPLANRDEAPLLCAAKYAELFYTYRNNLIHEFREPGYGVEWAPDEVQPYYHALINQPWQLVFPVGFFVRLYEQALCGLEAFLLRSDIDPYSQFKFGSRWRAH
jgi:hypothetical protein